jgi:mannose-6-phosphate isomerase-like protein (cupin superfamily)
MDGGIGVSGIARFPGAVGVSHLRVYDSRAPDGLAGGTPHVHTVCTEAYLVVSGAGAVQTLTVEGHRETPLEPGVAVWFTPGTIHRLVNHGDLELFVLMQNDGLPEAGDMVITFDAAVLADAARYEQAAALPPDDRTTAGPGEAARRRRDAAVPPFLDLVDAVRGGDQGPLAAFYDAAAALVRPRLEHWTAVWRDGPLAAAEETGRQLTALASRDADHLAAATVRARPAPVGERHYGCCGTLGVVLDP